MYIKTVIKYLCSFGTMIRSLCSSEVSQFQIPQTKLSVCNCDNAALSCISDPQPSSLSYMKTATNANLYNISAYSYNVSDYLLNTFTDYMLTRYVNKHFRIVFAEHAVLLLIHILSTIKYMLQE